MPSSPPRKVVDFFLASCLSAYALGLAIFRVDQIATCCLSRGSACTSGLLGTIVLSHSLADLPRSRCLLHLLSLILVSYLLDHTVPKSLPAPDVDYYSGRTVVVTGANAGIGSRRRAGWRWTMARA